MADNRRMQNTPPGAALADDRAQDSSFSLQDIYPVLRYNLRFVAIVLLASLVVATAWMKIKGPAYIARMVVSQADGLPQSSSGASSLLGSLGSLSGAAGLGGLLGGIHSPLYERFEELLSSQRVAARVESKHHVMQHLFEPLWDADHGVWRQPGGPVSMLSRALKDFFGMPGWSPPDAAALTRQIQRKLVISDTKDTGLREIQFEDKDREFALSMLTWLYQEADGSIRENDIVRTKAQIDYLRSELNQVTSVEQRTALTNLLETQEQRRMLLLSNAPYGAAVIVSPEAPTIPNSPKITITFAIALIVGFLLSGLVLMMKAANLRQKLAVTGATDAQIAAALKKPLIEISWRMVSKAVAQYRGSSKPGLNARDA
jgi:hypothetical protein